MKDSVLSLASLIAFIFFQTVSTAPFNQGLSPSSIARDDIPTKTREKRDTQPSCDSIFGYPPASACEAAMAMLPTDEPSMYNMYGMLGPANMDFYSFEPMSRPFYMLNQEGDNGNIWAAGL